MTSPSENEIIEAAVAYLNANAGEHRRARWHVDVEREPGQSKASAFVGSLRSEDAEAIEAKRPFIGHHLIGGKLNPLIEATNDSSPIATVDFTFERDVNGWKHTGFVHTVADRKALDADRAELDGRLRESLLAKVCDGWSSVRFQHDWNKPLRFTRMVDKKPEQLSSEGPVEQLLADYRSFFEARGLELQSMTALIEPKPKGKFELKLSYGVPRPRAK